MSWGGKFTHAREHEHARARTHIYTHTQTLTHTNTPQFFELMDVAQLLEGNTETRSRDAFVKMAPILHPLASTAGIAGIVVSTSERAFARTHARARAHTHTHTHRSSTSSWPTQTGQT